MNKQRTTRKRLVRSVTAMGALALVAGSLTAGLAGVASAAGNPPWEPVANPPEAGGLLFFNAAGQQITGEIGQHVAAGGVRRRHRRAQRQ